MNCLDKNKITFRLLGYLPKVNKMLFSLFLLFHTLIFTVNAQQVIQLKVFTEDLKPYGNVSLSINQGAFFNIPATGVAFVNLSDKQFPVKTITTSDNTLEAASWNFGKGILEVTIRKKSYINQDIVVTDSMYLPLPNILVEFRGSKTVNLTTNAEGIISIPLGLNEEIKGIHQFRIKNYDLVKFEKREESQSLIIKKVIASENKSLKSVQKVVAEERNWESYVSDRLPAINSIQEFYIFLYDLPKDKINTKTQALIDQKFQQLISDMNYSANADTISFINNITDTTIVELDIDNLVRQARKEGERLSEERIAFEDKIKLVKNKLNIGFENLSGEAKDALLSDINLLEAILLSNKIEFNDNQDIYKEIINELKSRFFDLKALENRFIESEQKRIAEKRKYRQQIIATLSVVLLFALLIILLFYLRTRLKKQQKDLIKANKVVKTTNENLEFIVSERTHLLQQTFKELDLVLYRASHDLRAPICSIAGLSDLIARDTGNNELTELVLKTNQQMDKLLKKLSTISEIHQPGDFKNTNVNTLIAAVVSRFDHQVKEGNVVLNTNLQDNLSIKTIPMLLDTITYHLLENAIYYSQVNQDDTAQIDLNVHKDENKLIIKIKDNGVGIEDGLIPKLFDMFYKGSEFSNGNGLGLYIVKKSVDLLSGEIEIKSVKGDYTEVEILIPLDLSHAHVLDFLKEAEVLK